jgi:hypothetical protein
MAEEYPGTVVQFGAWFPQGVGKVVILGVSVGDTPVMG